MAARSSYVIVRQLFVIRLVEDVVIGHAVATADEDRAVRWRHRALTLEAYGQLALAILRATHADGRIAVAGGALRGLLLAGFHGAVDAHGGGGHPPLLAVDLLGLPGLALVVLLTAEESPLLVPKSLLHALQGPVVLLHSLLLLFVKQVNLMLQIVQVPEPPHVLFVVALELLLQLLILVHEGGPHTGEAAQALAASLQLLLLLADLLLEALLIALKLLRHRLQLLQVLAVAAQQLRHRPLHHFTLAVAT
mmetsp:Transcript_91450/g.217930  ORF Transcript_91450/g.217930 Transcript_91450/m.217930 type:complete len:250 (+) Transcript_91450:76-825(+)